MSSGPSEIECPFDVEVDREKRFTYLDTESIGGGRHLLVFHKHNVVNLHNVPFLVHYRYDASRIYFKPALIITGIFTFFVGLMFVTRVTPSLER